MGSTSIADTPVLCGDSGPDAHLARAVRGLTGRLPRFWFAAAVAGTGLLSGIVWNTLGGIASQGGTFLSSLLVARLLGKELFGRFAMIQTTIAAVTNLASLGLGITATKYVSEYQHTDPGKAGRILALSNAVAFLAGVCFALLLAALAPQLAPGKGSPLTAELRISAGYVLFVTLTGSQLGALAGFGCFRRIARINVWNGTVTLLSTGTLAAAFGLRGAVWAQVVWASVLWFCYRRAIAEECRRRRIPVCYRGIWKERTALWRFSLPATAAGIAGSLAMWWCNAALVRFSGYAELAIFAAVNNMRLMVLFLPSLITKVASPILNSLRATGQVNQYRRMFWWAVAVNASIATLLACILTMAGAPILHWFGKEFHGSAFLVAWLLGSVVLEVLASNLYQAVFASGNMWRHVLIVVFWSGALTLLSCLAIPRYGASGLAMAYLVAWSLSALAYGTIAISALARRAGWWGVGA